MTVATSYANISASSSETHLEPERGNRITQEYSRGEIYNLADKSDAHDTICVNAIALLKAHIRSIGYHIHTGSMRINIDEEGNIFHYPDVMVTGDRRDGTYQYFKRYPRLLVEVTSRLTEGLDRGEKFSDYRKLETLQEYLLISEERVNVEHFRKNCEGEWVYHSYAKGAEIYLPSIDFRIPIAALYEDVSIVPTPRYSIEQKTRTENYLKFSSPSNILPGEEETQVQMPTSLPVTKFVNDNKLKPYIFVGLGTAAILGLAGSQAYSFWHDVYWKNKAFSSGVEQTNTIATPVIAAKTESPPISEENEKEKPENELNTPQIEQVGESGARKAIASINRMQKGFFSENERFATTWEDLGLNIQSKDEAYEYKIVWSDQIKTIVTATANKPDLKSYTGVVTVQGETAMDKICQTNESSNTPPVINEITGKRIECPSGSSSVATTF